MTKKALAMAASNSQQSINRALVTYASQLLEDFEVEYLDLNDYEMPIYSQDRENASGIPLPAQQFLAKIESADVLLIAFAEHNGGYTVAYKNVFDWASRHLRGVYQNKPTVMMATSPGPSGAKNVLNMAVNAAQFHDGNVVASFSLPSFYDNFDQERKIIIDQDLNQELSNAIRQLQP